jgi:hypothetical protein
VDEPYPVQFSVEYPDRPLNRVTTAFRLFTFIPIAIVLAGVAGGFRGDSDIYVGGDATTITIGSVGLVFFPTVLLLLFRQRYPRWWFEWNRELMRFASRVGIYLALMDDRYPSTEDRQAVTLDFSYPDARRDLNRWLPIVKWFLAIPHYLVLAVLYLVAVFVVVAAWFTILFSGRYPRALFDYLVGVGRWHNRVLSYAFALVTDRYPPFRLEP